MKCEDITVTTERKDYKNRSEVKVRNGKTVLSTYRFPNVDIGEVSKYISWQNLNCCGGWIYDHQYLNYAVQEDKKLFANYFVSTKEIEQIRNSLTDRINFKYVKTTPDSYEIHMCKKGILEEYIDLEKVLNAYKRLGIEISVKTKEKITLLSKEEMCNYFTLNNKYKFDYTNPQNQAELIFNGMLLGYAIESTASLIFSEYYS